MKKSNINISSDLKTRNQQSRYALSINYLIKKITNQFDPLRKSTYFKVNIENGNKKELWNSCSNTYRLKKENSRRAKTQYLKRRNKHNILTIDLRKIEENPSLTSKEKIKLKRMLDYIRFENKDEINRTKMISKTTSTYGTISKRMISKKRCNKVEELQNSVSDKKFSNNNKKSISTHTACKVNQEQINGSKYKEIKSIKVLGNQSTDFKLPAEKRYDVSNCTRNTIKELLTCTTSCSNTKMVLRAKPDVFTKYLRSKYIYPTYIVQYSNDGDRDFSRATLKAHLGQGQCPRSIISPEQLIKSDDIVNDDEEEEYVIAKGNLTASDIDRSFRVLNEVRKSLFPNDNISSNSSQMKQSFHVRGRSLSEVIGHFKKESIAIEKRMSAKPMEQSSTSPISYPGSIKNTKPHWNVESFPSTLYNLEKDVQKSQNKIDSVEKKLRRNNSTMNKIKECFMKACLCFCFHHDSNSLYQENYTNSQSSEKFVKPTNSPRSSLKDNYKITRITESKFLNKNIKTALTN